MHFGRALGTTESQVFKRVRELLNLLARKRPHRPPEDRPGEPAHEPQRRFHSLMRTASRFAEIVNETRQRSDLALRVFRAREIATERCMDQLDHQLRRKARETN